MGLTPGDALPCVPESGTLWGGPGLGRTLWGGPGLRGRGVALGGGSQPWPGHIQAHPFLTKVRKPLLVHIFSHTHCHEITIH